MSQVMSLSEYSVRSDGVAGDDETEQRGKDSRGEKKHREGVARTPLDRAK